MSSESSSAAPRYVRAARVFAANGGAAIEDGVVEIADGRIVGVWDAHVPLAPEVVHEYPTGTILPGLVDAHCHLTLAGDGRTYEEMYRDSDEMMALVSVWNMQRHLACGVTTLRDNGGRNMVTFVVRDAIQRGYFVGPRLLLSGRPVTHSYGHFFWCNGTADGVDEIRTTVRRLVAEGADHIKIMASGGGTGGNIPYYASYGVDELRAAVEAAHALGRLTTAHCRARQAIVNALDAGLDCIEHAEFLVPSHEPTLTGHATFGGRWEYDPAIGRRLVDSGTYVSFTLQPGFDPIVELREKEAREGLTPAEATQKASLEGYLAQKVGVFTRLLEEGMLPRLVVSSDAGPFDIGFARMRYGAELAVAGGMTPGQAIEACTRVAAEACGVASVVGTLEAGKRADILVVEGDPLTDVRAIGAVLSVYKDGHLVHGAAASRAPVAVGL